MADLEERLRGQAYGIRGTLHDVLLEAADLISAQTQTITDQAAEIERLKNLVHAWEIKGKTRRPYTDAPQGKEATERAHRELTHDLDPE